MYSFERFERYCNTLNEILAEYPEIVARDIGDLFTMLARGEI